MDAHALTDIHADYRASLIERDVELGLADDALLLAAAGRGSVLVFEGSAGLGKSALLGVVRADARAAGLAILEAAGRELEQDIALGVVLQLLEARVAAASDDERAALFAGAAGQALPLFAEGPRQALFDPPTLLHGLYRLCANLASGGRPLLLTVDDADFADVESLRFLLYLIERVETLPLVLVLSAGGAARNGDVELVERTVAHPAVLRSRLQALTAPGTALRLRTAWVPGASEPLCAAVYEASGGNPHLVDALGAELRAQVQDDEIGPEGVSTLVPVATATKALARARGLGPGGPAVLRAAAVLGPGSELRHVAVVADVDGEKAARIVDRLVASGLLSNAQGVSFVHPVVGDAIRAVQPQADRSAANLRAAERLSEEEASPERVAAHLLEAPRVGNAWAVANLCSAAEVALGRGEPGDAVRYLRRALEEPPPRAMRAHVMLELGRAEATAGDPAALTRLEEAVERAPEGPEGARKALETGRALFAVGRPADAAEAFARALDEIGDDDADLARALAGAHRAVSWLRSPSIALIKPAGQTAGDEPLDRPACALAAFDAAARGAPHHEAHELAVKALDRGMLLDEETADGIAYYFAASALIMTEDLQTAEAALTAAIENARSRGSVLGFATASLVRSLAIGRRGRVADAAADARLALAAERHGWRIGSAGARALLAGSLVEAGDLDGAARHLAAAERGSSERDPAWTGLLASRGGLWLATARPDKALADFLLCGERLERAGIVNPALVSWRSGAARAHVGLGNRDEAVRLAEEELELARAFGAPGVVGSCLRTLGSLTGGAQGVELLEEAVAKLEESQLALDRARALVDLGAALRRLGRRAVARDPLRHGADLARRCGAEQLVERALGEGRLAGARPRRTALYGLDALTPRERETSELAAQGLSNKEIADALFVTVKTVEWHLKHSYRKLGVSSRRDLRDLLDGHPRA